jgi:DNA-binding MarR family transcriptional regulator
MKGSKKSSSEDELAGEVVALLRDLLHALLRSSIPAWVDLQLTLPQLRTVFLIAHNQTSSVMQISQQLGIGEPTASHLIDKLVQAGLIQRSDDPQDRRRARVQLSPDGENLIERLLGWEDLLGGWLNQVPTEDLSMLRHGLTAIMNEIPIQAATDKPASQEAKQESSKR